MNNNYYNEYNLQNYGQMNTTPDFYSELTNDELASAIYLISKASMPQLRTLYNTLCYRGSLLESRSSIISNQ